MIPKQFGDWQMDASMVPLQVSPDVQANLDRIYNQTLSRTYINEKGERIMLSIAYGGDQSDTTQVHKPEVCYPAQGFAVEKLSMATLDVGYSKLPIKRMVAVQGNRVEPVTYWITVGNQVTSNATARKLAQLKYGLTGKIPDGLLFRVSSISRDDNAAFAEQAIFIRNILSALSPEMRAKLIGAQG